MDPRDEIDEKPVSLLRHSRAVKLTSTLCNVLDFLSTASHRRLHLPCHAFPVTGISKLAINIPMFYKTKCSWGLQNTTT
jgi:hypothetical protein